MVALTLDDAVKFALERNLDIAVQRLNPEINDIAYASIKSVYHPSPDVAASPPSRRPTRRPARSQAAPPPAQPIVLGATNYNGGIAQSIPWGGGSARCS